MEKEFIMNWKQRCKNFFMKAWLCFVFTKQERKIIELGRSLRQFSGLLEGLSAQMQKRFDDQKNKLPCIKFD